MKYLPNQLNKFQCLNRSINLNYTYLCSLQLFDVSGVKFVTSGLPLFVRWNMTVMAQTLKLNPSSSSTVGWRCQKRHIKVTYKVTLNWASFLFPIPIPMSNNGDIKQAEEGASAQHIEKPQATWTPEAERRLVRKMDLRILPMLILMYILNYVDRTK